MSRKLNALEQKIHQAALAADDKTITSKELEALAADRDARTGALNFLLSAGLLKVLKDNSGRLTFRAVVKKELDAKKDLSGEESLMLGHIQAAGNEGIWTKHIKAKTELHQTVIDRCLKSLTQKKLVKCISGSVQHPTRKIYMLFHLEPSTEMTGGPWYTDKELDTEFIKLLTAACLKFIRDRSYPRSKSGEAQRLLYPISAAPSYPTAAQVQAFLNKSRITETQLTVEHVETLLNVLVLDGDVEKVPALGATLWESTLDDGDEASSSEDEKARSKKRKRDDDSAKRKKKRRRTHSSDESDSDSDSDGGGSKRAKSKSKSVESKSKTKKRKKHAESDTESDASGSESEAERRRGKKAKKRKSREESASEESEDEDKARRKKKRAKSKSKKHASSSSDSSPDSESDAPKRGKSKSKCSSSRTKTKTKRAASPTDEYDDLLLGSGGGAHVYRAVRAERMAHFGLGQAPCGRCPVFDFCTAGGPVNPQECVYYGDWLGTAEAKVE